MKTKTTKDGFLFAIIPHEEAKENFDNLQIFKLFPDDVESLINNYRELYDAIDLGIVLGAEIGDIEALRSDYAEAKARNNENRSFEYWIDGKIENLLN